MAKISGLGHIGIASLSLAALMMSACTTVPLPQGEYPPQGPVVQRPPTAPVVTPSPTQTETETETPEVEKEVEVKEEPKEPEVTTEPEQPTFETGEYFNNRDGLTPPHMAGRDIKRMAILLPFSAKSSRLREEADSMLKAAELAVFNREGSDVLLMALDTRGTSDGARSATRSAIKSGADVILGPILAGSVKASAREASRSGTPLIAFSTDQTVAGNGTYLLSFPPEAEVKRIVDYVATTGARRFAYIGPQSEYGRRVKGQFDSSVAGNAGEITASEIYDGKDISVMQEPAKRLAEFHRQGEIAAKEAAKGFGDIPPMSYEALLLPEGGTALRSLAPLFPYYDVDPAKVQFLGTGLWKNDETVREPALNGGIFAAADQDAKQPFLDNFAVGAYVADGDPRGRQFRAEDPNGFYGVDGLVRFNANGTPDRGLAVYQIKNGRFVIIDPAPKTVLGPS